MEGLPLHKVKSPYLRTFIKEVQKVPGYKPPGYDTLRTTLLDQAKQRVAVRLQPWEDRMAVTGTTICSDGWSDAQNRPLLNILGVNPKGAKFITSFDTSGNHKTAQYIAACLFESIDTIGAENVVQVVTDSAATCKAAGKLIEERYPHITWSPCVAHVCDLALEDIFSLDDFKDVYTQTKSYVAFITNHHATLAAWRDHAVPGDDAMSNLQLIKPGETRFGSPFLMLERVLKVKARLQQFVVSNAWSTVVGNIRSADQAGAEEHKDTVLSAAYWKSVKLLCDLVEPIIKLLRNSDGDTPTVGKVHYYAYKIKEHLAGDVGLSAGTQAAVQQVWERRWAFMDSPIHGAAYCLDPEFLGDAGLQLGNRGDTCVSDLRAMLSKLLPPHEAQNARLSYASFRAREGELGCADAVADADSMPAHQRWDMYGGKHPELQKVAIRLLSHVSSACSCERSWSAYDYIHNRRRNRLSAARARDLVFVFSNGRLVMKMGQSEEGFVGWDEEEEMMEGSGSEQE